MRRFVCFLIAVSMLVLPIAVEAQSKFTVAVADQCGFIAKGASITLTALVQSNPNGAIASVQFQIDGVNTGALLTTAPYSVTWDSTKVTNGCHAVTAVVLDSAGNSGTGTMSVSVKN